MRNEMIRKLAKQVSKFTWAFYILCLFITVLLIVNHTSHVRYERYLISINENINKELIEQGMESPTAELRRVVKFYNEIVITHGKAYNKNKPEAMNTKVLAKFYVNMYKYNKACELPLFGSIAISMIETSFNPNAKGSIGEAGIFQLHSSAVGQAIMFHRQMQVWNPSVAEMLNFVYLTQEDLFDPLNSLKIATILLWGYKRIYQNDPIWYVTTYHWGQTRIDPYFYNDLIPETDFVFNRGKLNEDVRNPFTYYFIWNRIECSFRNYSLNIGLPVSYMVKYRELASREELEYIKNFKFMKRLLIKIENLKELEKEHSKELHNIEVMTQKSYKDYLELKDLIKSGKFKKIKNVWAIAKTVYKNYLKEVTEDKRLFIQKYILYITSGIIIGLFIFSLFGIVILIHYIRLRIKYKKINNHGTFIDNREK